MSAPAYEFLEIPDAALGETCIVATCDTFEAALQACKDGCHSALINNDETQRLYRAMKAALGFKSAARSKKLMTAVSQRMLGHFGDWQGVAFLRTRDITTNTDVHTHRSGQVYTGVLSTTPTTILFGVLPHCRDNTLTQWFNSENGTGVVLEDVDCTDSVAWTPFSPMPGSVVLMFTQNGQSQAHCTPPVPESQEHRALCVFTLEAPAP